MSADLDPDFVARVAELSGVGRPEVEQVLRDLDLAKDAIHAGAPDISEDDLEYQADMLAAQMGDWRVYAALLALLERRDTAFTWDPEIDDWRLTNRETGGTE